MTLVASLDEPRMTANNRDFTREDLAVLSRLLATLDALRDIKHNMTVRSAATLIRVALNEGKSVADLTREVGIAQSVMSRDLLDLGPWTRNREEGLGLVEHRLSPVNMRIHEISLTRKGSSLVRRLVGMLKSRRED